jgi:DNA polymerase III subunit delta
MAVKPPVFERALDAPDGKIRLYLVHGADEAGARAMATRLERAIGANAERIDLDGPTLREDPARLADEAAAMSLFGDKRWVRVSGGDECTAAIDALLTAPVAGNPVIFIAASLKATGALLKRVQTDPAALVCQLYRAETGNLASLAEAIARPMGLRLGRGVANALAANALADRSVIERELEKIALYLDAAPDRPREVDLDTLAAIGATLDEADPSRLVDTVLNGQLPAALAEIATIEASGAMIPALRALSRRVIFLARLRAAVDAGGRPEAVIAAQGKAIFWKDVSAVTGQLRRWPAHRLAVAQDRLFSSESAMMARGSAGTIIAQQVLLDIARVGERLR